MSEVEPRLKDNVGDCGCGCGATGTLRARPWSNGQRCVKRGCDCRRCLGRRSKEKGGKRQARAARAVGIPRSNLSPGHEEFLGGTVRIEVKAGAQVGPILTRYRAMEAQSEAARPFGDSRPFVGVAMPEGVSWGIVMIRTDRLPEAVAALAEQLGVVA